MIMVKHGIYHMCKNVSVFNQVPINFYMFIKIPNWEFWLKNEEKT